MTKLSFSLPPGGIFAIEEFPDRFSVSTTPGVSPDTAVITVDHLPDYLVSSKVLVIDSVLSGNRIPTKDPYRDVLQPLLKRIEIPHEYIRTTSPDSVFEIGSRLDPSSKYLLILISGDTSLNELINSLPDKFDVTILPVIQGTGNAFANSIGLSTVLDAVRSLLTGAASPFPLYEANFHPQGLLLDSQGKTIRKVESILFFAVGSWCLHATLVADSATVEMRQKYKELRFRKAAERILSENPEFPGKITLLHSDGSPELPLYSKPLSYFLVTALPKFEATFLISPDSVPERPQLHLLYFEHTDSDSTMKIMNEAYDHGVHVENPLVNYLAIGPRDSVKLELDDSVQRDYLSKICIDGSVVLMKGKERSITFGNSKRKGLKFVS